MDKARNRKEKKKKKKLWGLKVEKKKNTKIATIGNTETVRYLCTIIKQVKHKVAWVWYVRGDNSLVFVVNIEVQTSVSVHYQSKA